MRCKLPLLGALMAIVLSGHIIACSEPEVDSFITVLHGRYGVLISYQPVDGLLPAVWQQSPYSGRVEPVVRRDLMRLLKVLDNDFGLYPRNVLASNLDEIRVVRSLELFGVQYAGTTFGNSIVMTADSIAEGYDEQQLALIFHHEFSSILMRDYGFDTAAWVAVNVVPLPYANSPDKVLAAIEGDAEIVGSPELYRRGLLANYGLASPEDDANLYAELIFTDPAKMRELASQYVPVRRKYEFLRDFYLEIDPNFNVVFARVEDSSDSR